MESAFVSAAPLLSSRVHSAQCLRHAHVRPAPRRARPLFFASASDGAGPDVEPAVTSGDTSLPVSANAPKPASPTPANGNAAPYSLRARLKEETEAPFRKVRMFVWGGCAASAGVGGFIALSRVAAALTGVTGVQPLAETVPNVLIDFGAVALAVVLLRAELRSGERRLARIARGARLAALRVRVSGGVRALSTLRGRRRVAVVAGAASAVLPALYSAHERREALDKADLSVIPYFADLDPVQTARVELPPAGEYLLGAHNAQAWRTWYEVECATARSFFGDAVDECLVVIVRLDGKVGARAPGAPDFDKLLAEIGRLPAADQYGRP